jgi:phytol kinase
MAAANPVVDPRLGAAALLALFVALLLGLHRLSRQPGVTPELTRKLLHVASGLLTLSFPLLFASPAPVLMVTGTAAAVLAAVRAHPPSRSRLGGSFGRVDRRKAGELYFPAAVAILFVFAAGGVYVLFAVPILVLTMADAAAALVGGRWGSVRIRGGKSLEGSSAFAIVAFFCTALPLIAAGGVEPGRALSIAVAVAIATSGVEAVASRGLDNLFVPIVAVVMLRAMLSEHAAWGFEGYHP